ncbi:hypothetical protein AAEX28_15525 [Lentisphaerota bacterium WC36G]|nr:hypothetical protein LJT99_15075 [Lentisphaerae bacterium WC36]UDQ98371.1 hypothetical protein LJT99_02280 [Lentisphaerae bacterium WC36]
MINTVLTIPIVFSIAIELNQIQTKPVKRILEKSCKNGDINYVINNCDQLTVVVLKEEELYKKYIRNLPQSIVKNCRIKDEFIRKKIVCEKGIRKLFLETMNSGGRTYGGGIDALFLYYAFELSYQNTPMLAIIPNVVGYDIYTFPRNSKMIYGGMDEILTHKLNHVFFMALWLNKYRKLHLRKNKNEPCKEETCLELPFEDNLL